jgi:hypothetical protein
MTSSGIGKATIRLVAYKILTGKPQEKKRPNGKCRIESEWERIQV